MRTERLRRIGLWGGLALVLGAVDASIWQQERLLADGAVVRLELAPVDPRSLLQGDYMALDYALARAAQAARGRDFARVEDGVLIVVLDAERVARLRRFDDGTPLAADERRLRYRVRDGRLRIATDAWFFQEGHAAVYAAARYGELRVAPDGEALLTGMLDRTFAPLEPPLP